MFFDIVIPVRVFDICLLAIANTVLMVLTIQFSKEAHHNMFTALVLSFISISFAYIMINPTISFLIGFMIYYFILYIRIFYTNWNIDKLMIHSLINTTIVYILMMINYNHI
jgi:hypothetical protein